MPSDDVGDRPTPELPATRAPRRRATTAVAGGRTNLPSASRTPVPDLREVGLPGTKILAGQIFEDPNIALQGMRGLRKFQLMGYDPIIAALLHGTSLPIRGARWYVQPATEDDPKHIEMANFIEWNLYHFGHQSMDDIVRQAVHGMCQYGFNVAENVYARIEDGKWAGKVGIDKLAWRALALDTPIPTPTGWTTMGEVRVGDRVFDEGGLPCTVIGKSPVYEDRPCYEIVLRSGDRIVADASHEWMASSQRDRIQGRAPRRVTTAQMAERVSGYKPGQSNWSIQGTAPLCWRASRQSPTAYGLPVDPYVLGVWLGDGTTGTAAYSVGEADEDEQAALLMAAGESPRKTHRHHWTMAARGERVGGGRPGPTDNPRGLRGRLRRAGVLLDKHIPATYLRGHPDDRLALLQGLMDSDGTVDAKGRCSFSNTSPGLVEGVKELVRSLGCTSLSEHWATNGGGVGRDGRRIQGRLPLGVISFAFHLPAFRLAHKRLRQRLSTRRAQTHFIREIREVVSVPVQCIAVDSPSRLYLAGRSMVPTHNSQFTRWRWNVEEVDTPTGGRMRQLVSMTQLAPPNYVTVDLPREKFIHWALNMDGENYDGIGLCRLAYKPWYFKDHLERIEAIGLERGYMGIPKATLPEDFTNKEFMATKQVVENLRTHENAGIVHPAQVEFDMLFNKLEGQSMHMAIDRYQHEILITYLAQFLLLGTGNIGSYALSNDQSDLFLLALNALSNYFAQQLNLWPGIPLWCKYNFPDISSDDIPRLVHGEIGERNLERMGRTMMALGQGGFLTPDDETEDALREQLALPMRDPSLAPEALHSLMQGIMGTVEAGRAHAPRPPRIPSAGAKVTTANHPEPQDARDAAAVMMSELLARRPWPRPKGRLTADMRTRIQNAEVLREELGWRPGPPLDTPGERAARRRRPYAVRSSFAEDRVSSINGKVGEADRLRAKRHARPSSAVPEIAARHSDAIREALSVGR